MLIIEINAFLERGFNKEGFFKNYKIDYNYNM